MNSTSGLIIFDCDGVLVDSEPIASRVLADSLTAIGYPLTAQQALARFTGMSLASVLEDVEAEWGRRLPAGFRELLRERDFAAFREELQPIAGLPGVLGEIELPRCVASSGALAKMRFTLGLTGLLPWFEPHLFSAEMVARGKPAPDLFLLAAEKMGVPPPACVVVEDSVAGVIAARAASMRALGFLGGGHTTPETAERLRAAGAETIFADMRALPGLL